VTEQTKKNLTTPGKKWWEDVNKKTYNYTRGVEVNNWRE
jgi:hypothetical protein